MQAGVGSIKIEGAGLMVERIGAAVRAGIPCMGHVGMTPQQIGAIGSYRTAGRSAQEAVQVHLPGNEPEELKREYGQDLAFYGAINTQRTLPFGSTEDVRAEVRKRIRVLGRGGGYICGSDHSILGDVPMDNVLAMLGEARRFRF